MFFKLKPFFYALLFLFGLEFLVYSRDFIFLVSAFMFFISLIEGKKSGKRWSFSVLPSLFTLATIALLYLITIRYEQQIFILLATSIYYLALFGAWRLGRYEGDKTARAMNMAATAATAFFFYAGIYGLYLNFLVPLYLLMLAYLLATLLISYQYFSIIKPQSGNIVWIYSFLLALVMAELIWTMNFWPFGYLTTGVIALMLYYVLWDLTQSYFLDMLSRRRVVANMVFFSVMIGFILLTSKWIPVI